MHEECLPDRPGLCPPATAPELVAHHCLVSRMDQVPVTYYLATIRPGTLALHLTDCTSICSPLLAPPLCQVFLLSVLRCWISVASLLVVHGPFAAVLSFSLGTPLVFCIPSLCRWHLSSSPPLGWWFRIVLLCSASFHCVLLLGLCCGCVSVVLALGVVAGISLLLVWCGRWFSGSAGFPLVFAWLSDGGSGVQLFAI
jgi:hypothetical protein